MTKVSSGFVTTLYTPCELEAREDFPNFPAYLKSRHQKVLNSFCGVDSCSLGSHSLMGCVFNVNQLIEGAEFHGSEILEQLNPFGFQKS